MRTARFFLKEQFYKNEAQICPKIKNKLRTIEARLHHITSSLMSVFMQLDLESLSEQRRNENSISLGKKLK